MRIRHEDDVTRFGIAQLRHELVANAVGHVDLLGAELFSKIVAVLHMIRIEGQARRDEVIEHDDYFILIPDLGKTHFLEFAIDVGCINIVKHDAVRMRNDDIAGLAVCYTCIMNEDFFC